MITVVFAQGIERVFNNLEKTATQIGASLLLVVVFFICLTLLPKSKIGAIVLMLAMGVLLGGMVVAPEAWWNMIEGTTRGLLQGT